MYPVRMRPSLQAHPDADADSDAREEEIRWRQLVLFSPILVLNFDRQLGELSFRWPPTVPERGRLFRFYLRFCMYVACTV
jgi:hypothetical protein